MSNAETATSVRMQAPKSLEGVYTDVMPSGQRYAFTLNPQRMFDAHPLDVKELEKIGFEKVKFLPAQDEAPAVVGAKQASTGDDAFLSTLDDAGITPAVAGALVKAGFDSVEKVGDASDEALLGVDGVGPATLEKLRSL